MWRCFGTLRHRFRIRLNDSLRTLRIIILDQIHPAADLVPPHQVGVERRLRLPVRPRADVAQDSEPLSQWVGREELFERERGGNPDLWGWDQCVRGCAGAGEILTQKLKTDSLPKECRPLTFHTADSL